MTPEEYLKSIGIEPNKYILTTYVDGVMRNSDLFQIMEGYRMQEKKKRTPENDGDIGKILSVANTILAMSGVINDLSKSNKKISFNEIKKSSLDCQEMSKKDLQNILKKLFIFLSRHIHFTIDYSCRSQDKTKSFIH